MILIHRRTMWHHWKGKSWLPPDIVVMKETTWHLGSAKHYHHGVGRLIISFLEGWLVHCCWTSPAWQSSPPPPSQEGDNMLLSGSTWQQCAKVPPCIQGGIDSGTSPNGHPQQWTPMIQRTILKVLTIRLHFIRNFWIADTPTTLYDGLFSCSKLYTSNT